MIEPESILEIGTFTGYSAICLAKGLSENGFLHTIDNNIELEEELINNFKEAELEDRIKLYMGDAIKIIPTLNYMYDIIYIDADKSNYLNYYKLCFDKLKAGGYIIADNVLWDGKVLNNPSINDKDTKGIIEFNKFIKGDNRVEKVILPIRDGLTIISKL